MSTTRYFTMKAQIAKAFNKLREEDGFFAEPDLWCCRTCGWAAVPDDAVNACFYHLRKAGECHIAWRGDGGRLKKRLEEAGLIVEWDGSERGRSEVIGSTALGQTRYTALRDRADRPERQKL